jgi:S-adenosylmethionine-diacylglycerol 3-amino-3-carboxypropyl transferase
MEVLEKRNFKGTIESKKFERGLFGRFFQFIYSKNYFYTYCWEDPAVDVEALEINSDDRIAVLTSGGCNALHYLLHNPERVYAVDLNPSQNAVLKLKVAGIKSLDFEEFFELFGDGRSPRYKELYNKIRPCLDDGARLFWDKKIRVFSPGYIFRSFFYSGNWGLALGAVRLYWTLKNTHAKYAVRVLNPSCLEQQKSLWYGELRNYCFTPFIKKLISNPLVLALIGATNGSVKMVETTGKSLYEFIEEKVDYVFGELPVNDNYFYHPILLGKFSRNCCPDYLKKENFERLKAGLIDKLTIFTGSMNKFLEKVEDPVSKFVLLDHMDWLVFNHQDILTDEWEKIYEKSTAGAMVLWRSAGHIEPMIAGLRTKYGLVKDCFQFYPEKGAELFKKDRVHSYETMGIARKNKCLTI